MRASDRELAVLRVKCASWDERCCGSPEWRYHLCEFHRGWIDGWDARDEEIV